MAGGCRGEQVWSDNAFLGTGSKLLGASFLVRRRQAATSSRTDTLFCSVRTDLLALTRHGASRYGLRAPGARLVSAGRCFVKLLQGLALRLLDEGVVEDFARGLEGGPFVFLFVRSLQRMAASLGEALRPLPESQLFLFHWPQFSQTLDRPLCFLSGKCHASNPFKVKPLCKGASLLNGSLENMP